MIKVQIITTVWQRPEITSAHIYWMKDLIDQFSQYGIEIRPFYVLDFEDPHYKIFLEQISAHSFPYYAANRGILSNKIQNALLELRRIEWDYLMHLDSDEFISPEIIPIWAEKFKQGVPWFGSASCFFYDWKTEEAYEFVGYDYHPIKNGGCSIHRGLIEQMNFELWLEEMNYGLNGMEFRRLQQTGHDPVPIDTQSQFGILEIKDEVAIHGMNWFFMRNKAVRLNMATKGLLYEAHPICLHSVFA